MIDTPRHTAKQIADDVAAGMDPDVEGVPAQYYDAAIQRIAELEATVARVKAESLRVVVDGKQDCVYCGGTDIECIHCYGYGKPVRMERWEEHGCVYGSAGWAGWYRRAGRC